jgi:DNA-binding IclR family transcriptional regulator
VVDPDKLSAELDLAARLGYALDLEEFREDVRCVAAPVLQAEMAIAAYTISAPANRFRLRRADRGCPERCSIGLPAGAPRLTGPKAVS